MNNPELFSMGVDLDEVCGEDSVSRVRTDGTSTVRYTFDDGSAIVIYASVPPHSFRWEAKD